MALIRNFISEDDYSWPLLYVLSTVQCSSLSVFAFGFQPDNDHDSDSESDSDSDNVFPQRPLRKKRCPFRYANKMPRLSSLSYLNISSALLHQFSDIVCNVPTKFPNLQKLDCLVGVDHWEITRNSVAFRRLSAAEPVALTELTLRFYGDTGSDNVLLIVEHLFRICRSARCVKLAFHGTDNLVDNLVPIYLSAYRSLPHATAKFTLHFFDDGGQFFEMFQRVTGESYFDIYTKRYAYMSDIYMVTDATNIRHVLGSVLSDAIQHANANVRSVKCYQQQLSIDAVNQMDILLNDKVFNVYIISNKY